MKLLCVVLCSCFVTTGFARAQAPVHRNVGVYDLRDVPKVSVARSGFDITIPVQGPVAGELQRQRLLTVRFFRGGREQLTDVRGKQTVNDCYLYRCIKTRRGGWRGTGLRINAVIDDSWLAFTTGGNADQEWIAVVEQDGPENNDEIWIHKDHYNEYFARGVAILFKKELSPPREPYQRTERDYDKPTRSGEIRLIDFRPPKPVCLKLQPPSVAGALLLLAKADRCTVEETLVALGLQ